MDDTKPLLFTVGAHQQQPLWKPLSDYYTLAFLNTQAAALANEMGLEAIAVEHHVDADMLNHAQNQAIWVTSIVTEQLKEGALVLDANIPELSHPGLGHWMPTFLHELIVGAIIRAYSAAKLLEKRPSAGVLVHEDVTVEGKGLALFGMSEGLPTLHIPHANHFLSCDGDIHSKVTAEFIGARGTYMRDWYLSKGVPEDKITLVGAPQWDWLYETEEMPTREHARRAFGFDKDELVLCYGTTWFQNTAVWGRGQEDLDEAWLYMLKAAQELKAKLFVKMHPGEVGGREKFYLESMKKHGVSGVIDRKHNEYAMIVSDCLVTQGSSNLAIEAAILGKPSVELWQCGTRYPGWIDGTWGEDLVAKIKAAMEAGPNDDFARVMNYDHDGKAVNRCVEWIRSLCQ